MRRSPTSSHLAPLTLRPRPERISCRIPHSTNSSAIGCHQVIIRRIRVKHFRSLLDASLNCDRLTALVGRNGAGKSSFLRALELFYDPTARATNEDYYAGDTSEDIKIAITYGNLPTQAMDLFAGMLTTTPLRSFACFQPAPRPLRTTESACKTLHSLLPDKLLKPANLPSCIEIWLPRRTMLLFQTYGQQRMPGMLSVSGKQGILRRVSD